MRLAKDPKAIAQLKKENTGSLFRKAGAAAIRNSLGILMVSAMGMEPKSNLRAGMGLQRAWIHANRLGYAIHPVSASVFLAHHNKTTKGEHLDPTEQETLTRINSDLRRIADSGPHEYPRFLMRVSKGGNTEHRSLRRPLAESMIELDLLTPTPTHG